MSIEFSDEKLSFSRRSLKRVRIEIVITVAVMIIIGVLSLALSELREYIINPVIRDALGFPSGYNVVNTAIYATELALSAYLVYTICLYFGIRIKYSHVLMFIPYVLSAAFLRVLEDIGVRFHYVFISPLLQIFIGAVFVSSSLIVGLIKRETVASSLLVVLSVAILAFLYYSIGSSPYALIPLALTPLYHFIKTKEGKICLTGALMMTLALISLVETIMGIRAFHTAPAKMATAILLMVSSLAVLMGITLGIGFSMILPIAVAQALDGSATFIAITMYGYYEKHVVSGALIKHSPVLYLALKIILGVSVGILVQYVSKEADRQNSAELKNVAYILLLYGLALGLGPGTRDLIRIILGV